MGGDLVEVAAGIALESPKAGAHERMILFRFGRAPVGALLICPDRLPAHHQCLLTLDVANVVAIACKAAPLADRANAIAPRTPARNSPGAPFDPRGPAPRFEKSRL
jgi:hypothetical protein